MTTNEIIARIDNYGLTSPLYEDELRDCLAGLQYNLSEHPLDAAAYAGMARCRELMGTAPITVLEHYVLSLTLNEENARSWEMLGEYAKRRAATLSPAEKEPSGIAADSPVIPIISIAAVAVKEATIKSQDLTQNKWPIFWNALKGKTHRKMILFLATCIMAGYAIMARAWQ